MFCMIISLEYRGFGVQIIIIKIFLLIKLTFFNLDFHLDPISSCVYICEYDIILLTIGFSMLNVGAGNLSFFFLKLINFKLEKKMEKGKNKWNKERQEKVNQLIDSFREINFVPRYCRNIPKEWDDLRARHFGKSVV